MLFKMGLVRTEGGSPVGTGKATVVVKMLVAVTVLMCVSVTVVRTVVGVTDGGGAGLGLWLILC